MFKLLLRSVRLPKVSAKCPQYLYLKRLSSKAFNTPRPPKDPPDVGYQPQSVDHEDIELADFVRPEAFRQFQSPDEVLGPGAGMSKEYKNPQYFGYHRFSYVELQNQSMELRDERRVNGGVQANMGEDDEDECPDDSIEAMMAQEAECNETLQAQAKDAEKDREKNKLKTWCVATEKKQEEIREVQKCEEIEKKKLQDSKSKSKIEKTIEKGAKEIMEECVKKMEKSAAAGECKEKVIKETLAELEKECKNLSKLNTKAEELKEKVKDVEEKIAKSQAKDDQCKNEKSDKKDEKKSDKCEKTDKNKK
ncbi:sperm-specific protein Don juan-like [Drosophila nasuta]|uniref:sperm-specific protein Don juan-like n=1 Tax=Drosophila nasuta TaxID=42062 RepID=UPI00295E8843|nr:sperm-specific protein Don juan-like [Drosophila nasuta]